MLDLILRARDLEMFYGDFGVLSRADMFRQTWYLQEFQPFLSTGSVWGLSVLFFLGMAGGLCLALGYRTRYAALFCWYFSVCLQLRNPAVLDGGDEFLRLLLFWCPFLPLGARWSMDARRHPEWRSLPNDYRSLATVGIYVQFFVLYFFAAYLKSGEAWHKTRLAIYYTLSIDQFSTHLGKWLLGFPQLLKVLTPTVLVAEFALALLLLVPARYLVPRLVFLATAWFFHLGLALCLKFGIFMLIMMVTLLVFVPRPLLDKLFPAQTGEAVENEPPAYKLSPLEKGFAVFVIFYILFVNVQSIKYRQRLPGWTMPVALIIYEHQHWHLFAPEPFREDGWFVFEVTDDQHKVWRELGAEDGSLDKPRHVSSTFPNQRWRRWFQNLVLEPFTDTQNWRNSTAYYLANRWLKNHPGKRIESYRLLFMEESTPPPGEVAVIKQMVLSQSVKK